MTFPDATFDIVTNQETFAAGRACARAMIDGDFADVRYAATKP